MIESDPLSIALFAHNGAQTVMQAGPPSDLPAQVPHFVGSILDAVRHSAGESGLGEMIRGLTPGGSQAAGAAENATRAAAEKAFS